MNENIQKWDLTTAQGFQKALASISPIAQAILNPVGFLIDFFNTDNSKQAELAERLIRTGKEEGADEIEITLKKSAGGKLNIPEEYKVDISFGKDDEMTIRVKYK